MDGTGLLFEPFVEALPDTLAPVVVSYPPDQLLGYEALLDRVLGALPRDAPFVLLGESFSGPLALMAAARRPEGLCAVVLCASFVRSPLPWLPSALHALIGGTCFSIMPEFARSAALLGRDASPEIRSLLRQAHALVTPDVMAARARAILGVDATRALEQCLVPILYLQAAADRMVTPGSWKLIAERRPEARVEVLPGPHLLLQTRPCEAVATIERFLRSVSTSALGGSPRSETFRRRRVPSS
jgi:pimeloyl-ACP methyl ester carboxylesterase